MLDFLDEFESATPLERAGIGFGIGFVVAFVLGVGGDMAIIGGIGDLGIALSLGLGLGFVSGLALSLIGLVSPLLLKLLVGALALLVVLAVVAAGLWGVWLLYMESPSSRLAALEADTLSVSVLAGSVLALTWVTFMRFYMRRATSSGSRIIVLYKTWHYPVFVIGNLFKPPFILLALAVFICAALVAIGIVLGYILGGAAGKTGALIGAAIALFGSALLCEPIVFKMADRNFMDALRHDMLSASPDLRTMNREYLFPFLCVIQSTILFGLMGSLVGKLLSQNEVSPVAVAAVSAFFAFFCSQLFSRAKQSIPTGAYRISLGVVQGVVIGVLLLPAKQLLGQNQFAASLLDQLASLFGDQLGLDAVFVSIMGLGTSAVGSHGKSES